jgi:CarboxypepD_reg-like domain/TonB-dependent Receptor Plug Domain
MFTKCNKFNRGSIFIVCLLLLAISTMGYGQQKAGKLTGKITDGATNTTLVAASVTPKGSKNGTASITDGTYILALPPGTYTIRYSSTGYQAKEISGVIIKPNETTFLDIALQTATKEMEGVVVTATVKKETQSTVYNKQKMSAAASDGISQEAIARTPDNNAAQVLRRVTGVNIKDNRFVVVRGLGAQYNQTMLNGVAMTSTETNQNAFAFDLIPAAAIDNIVINKTATPDMPGNFAGGIVQVNTKDFPAKDFFSVAIQAGFSDQTYGKDFYSDKRGNMEWLGYGGKRRDLPKGFPQYGVDRVNLGTLNDQERTRLLRLLPNNLVPINNGASNFDFNDNVQLGFGKTIKLKNKNQIGIIAAITQRKTKLIENERRINGHVQYDTSYETGLKYLADETSINTRYRYSSEIAGVLNVGYNFGNNKITLKSLYSNLFRNTFVKRDSAFQSYFNLIVPSTKEIEGFSYYTQERNLINTVLAGEHKTGLNNDTRIDWNVNISSVRTNAPDARNFVFLKDSANLYNIDNSGISIEAVLSSKARLWTETKDFITGGVFNLTSVFKLFNTKQVVKGGVLFQNRLRRNTNTAIPYNDFNLPQPLKLDTILAPGLFGIIGGALTYFDAVGLYNAGTATQAAYCSFENKFDTYFRLIWGLRVEHYQQSLNTYKPVFPENFAQAVYQPYNNYAVSRNTINFLPSFNFIYSPVSSVNIRAAYSKTVIRPDLKDLSKVARYDFEALELSTGNTQLKSTGISNYDIKVEWFPSSGEIFSIGAFQKKLINPIEYIRIFTNARVGNKALNSGNATVKGIEAEIRKRLDFIAFAPWLKNISVFGNGTIINSKVNTFPVLRLGTTNIFDYVPEHTLTGQPPYIINLGISIAAFKNTFEATFSYNKTGDYVNQLGSSDYLVGTPPKGRTPALSSNNYILQARNLVDVVIRKTFFNGKAQVKFNITNLLAKPLIIYQDLNDNNKRDTPLKIDLDLQKADPASAIKGSGIDNDVLFVQGQRNFSLTFTYTF